MKTLDLACVCGGEVLSRANVRKIYSYISDETMAVDFANVEFVSRSAADELCGISESHGSLEFLNMSDNVSEMMAIVGKGRKSGRGRIVKPTVSTTYYCRTMQDLRNALSQGI